MLARLEAALRFRGYSWIALVIALAIHVFDEAVTGFLPVYNQLAIDIRESYHFVPLPTFSFSVWLAGLIGAIIALAALSPLAFTDRRWLRYLSYAFATIMILNGAGHIGASLYVGAFAPGVYSSPLLVLSAIMLAVWTARASATA